MDVVDAPFDEFEDLVDDAVEELVYIREWTFYGWEAGTYRTGALKARTAFHSFQLRARMENRPWRKGM